MHRSDRRVGRDEEQLAVIRKLEEDIIFRTFDPGQRLVEDVLMSRYQTSRHFVRQALAQLERLGIVQRVKNVGATVVTFTPDDVHNIYQVLEILIRQAIQSIDLPTSAQLIGELEKLNRIHCETYASGQVRKTHETNDDFHFALFAACKNRYLFKLLQDYIAMTLPMRAKSVFDAELRGHFLRQHEQIIALMSGSDRWALAQLCIEHLQPSKMEYLRYLATLT
jgi:DNA-binding GntR family transcriptional regulator